MGGTRTGNIKVVIWQVVFRQSILYLLPMDLDTEYTTNSKNVYGFHRFWQTLPVSEEIRASAQNEFYRMALTCC